MRLVLDTNIFFSLMNPKSVNSYLFSFLISQIEFISPEFLKSELEEHKSECIAKSRLSEHEFEIRQNELEEFVKFIKTSEYEEFLDKSMDLISDSKDIDFLALALSINASIWSNDPHFKQQSLIKVFTTEDLLKLFLENKI